MAKNDGGPAFACTAADAGCGSPAYTQNGISLRDYFAGQALAGMLANPNIAETVNPGDERERLSVEQIMQVFCCMAYDHADTMLRWREKAEAAHE